MTSFKIETIKDKVSGNEVSFCSTLGGIVTSLKLKGKEILYFDEKTFNVNESVRGGIPILFPNAGELRENNLFPNLRRHGFARNLEWQIDKRYDGFIESISSSSKTLDLYPYNFELTVSGYFENENSFVFSQVVENLDNKQIPISMGLHPYFNVKNEFKKDIKFNFEGGKEIEDQIDVWQNGGTIMVDNPKIKYPDSTVEICIPDLGKIILDISIEYQKIWIWSQPEKDFICIEPMMRGENGLIDNPLLIKEGDSVKTFLKISLI